MRSICCTPEPAAAAKSLQSCLTLCDPIDISPPGSPVPGILQARTLEWVAISLSNAWKWKVKVKSLSCVWLLATPWTAAHQAPPSMGFSRQGYWSGLPHDVIYQLYLNKKWGKCFYGGLGGLWGFPGGLEVKAFAWNAGNPGWIPGSGRSPGEGNGNPLQYSCLENPMEGGAW